MYTFSWAETGKEISAQTQQCQSFDLQVTEEAGSNRITTRESMDLFCKEK